MLNLILAYVLREFAEGCAALPVELETGWQCMIREGAGGQMFVTCRPWEDEDDG